MDRSDSDLLRSAATGDREAFTDLMARYAPQIISYVRFVLGGSPDAEDVAQETFIEAYRSAGRFDGRATALPWLLGIAANRCRMWARGTGPSAVPLETLTHTPDRADGDARTNPGDARAQLRLDIQNAVSRMAPKYRTPLLLRFQQGLSYREMADALGISETAAAARLHRAKAVLRRRLGDLDREVSER